MSFWKKLKDNLPAEIAKGLEDVADKVEKSGVLDDIAAGINTAKEKIEESGVIDDLRDGFNQAKDKLEESGVIDEIKKATQEGVSALEKAADKIKVEVNNHSTVNSSGNYPSYNPAINGSIPYFSSIIKEHIPDVEVREEVNLSEVSQYCPVKQVKIDILIYKHGMPRLAILLVPKDKYKNQCYTNTILSCKKAGVNTIQFMKEFRNDPDYVVDRILKEMR